MKYDFDKNKDRDYGFGGHSTPQLVGQLKHAELSESGLIEFNYLVMYDYENYNNLHIGRILTEFGNELSPSIKNYKNKGLLFKSPFYFGDSFNFDHIQFLGFSQIFEKSELSFELFHDIREHFLSDLTRSIKSTKEIRKFDQLYYKTEDQIHNDLSVYPEFNAVIELSGLLLHPKWILNIYNERIVDEVLDELRAESEYWDDDSKWDKLNRQGLNDLGDNDPNWQWNVD